MSKPNILISGHLPDVWRSKLEGLGLAVHAVGFEDLVELSAFKKQILGKDIYVSGGYESLTRPVIDAADRLALAIFLGAGYYQYFDVPAASQRGIKVCNTPGANALSVAEFTVGLMLSAWRCIPFLSSELRERRWSKFQGHEIRGKTLGIVGLGRIGSIVAEIAKNGLGMNVAYWSRSRKPDQEQKLGITWCLLQELLSSSDVVSLHIGGPEDNQRFGEPELRLLKPSAILINTARASLVSPEALFRALDEKRFRAAAFDGFYIDGSAKVDGVYSELLSLPADRFFVTPHSAWRTDEADDRMFQMALDSIADFLAGRTPANCVNFS